MLSSVCRAFQYVLLTGSSGEGTEKCSLSMQRYLKPQRQHMLFPLKSILSTLHLDYFFLIFRVQSKCYFDSSRSSPMIQYKIQVHLPLSESLLLSFLSLIVTINYFIYLIFSSPLFIKHNDYLMNVKRISNISIVNPG